MPSSQIRQLALCVSNIGLVHLKHRSQMTLTLGALFPSVMTGTGLPTFDRSGSPNPKFFSSQAVGLHLWHKLTIES